MQTVTKKFWLTPVILIAAIILLHLLSLQTSFIENVYSTHVYQVISSAERLLTRWFPFSVGDVLYAIAIIWLLIKIVLFFRRKPTWRKLFFGLRNLCVQCLWLYIFFLVSWGLNYYRFGIGYKLDLKPEKYSTEDLKTITAQIRDRLNTNRKLIDSLHLQYADNAETLQQAVSLYSTAQTAYPFLVYRFPAVKKMMFGIIGNYAGFLGYYNPFTGEAQVNTSAPLFVIPFTTCHEIAHQLGFASEGEASFVGYLVEQKGSSPIFNYSAYFDLFGFANGELYGRDSIAAKENFKLLDTLVRKDYAEYRTYLRSYKNPVEPLLTKLYGNYLKAHNQPKGIESYNEVVAWIVAYYKKYGKL